MGEFFEKHKNASFVNSNNYEINKWIVIVEGFYYESGYNFVTMVRTDENQKLTIS